MFDFKPVHRDFKPEVTLAVLEAQPGVRYKVGFCPALGVMALIEFSQEGREHAAVHYLPLKS